MEALTLSWRRLLSYRNHGFYMTTVSVMKGLSKSICLHSSTYENFIFKVILKLAWNICYERFLQFVFSINKLTCWKNPSKPFCIRVVEMKQNSGGRGGLDIYQKMLANWVSCLRRSFNWSRLKCPEIINRVEVGNVNFQHK